MIALLSTTVIPLAKKLKSCGVFGVSSDEYLSYAVQNRKEWEAKGEAMVAEMKKRYSQLQIIEEDHSATTDEMHDVSFDV